ncbi:D-glucose O-methyltransferase [Streptomyces sp. WAC 06738]|uniref:methyltransferase domain-containing protein n=1 Tax=Streptomyces sp. WAC 06738 TaxID=2203210 RepID=UPI000F6C61AB|nr:methyltransferase domain-containing protein [Streptomyces sp. WAC 06738]AZM45751.1 D-glucose O-methyltransferase [Streptomyces sp. WAC 06738]
MAQRPARTEESDDKFFDSLTGILAEAYGSHLHFGYWDASGDGSLAAATSCMTDQVIKRTRVRAGQRVLDIGCGTGAPALRLAHVCGVEVVGVSVSAREVDRANERSRREGLAHRVRFESADAMALPYADGSFDAVWAIESMSHMPDRGRVFCEIGRVLAPDGRLVIADGYHRGADPEASSALMDTMCTAFRMHSPPTLTGYEDLLTAAGLRTLETLDLSDHAWRSIGYLTETLRARSPEFAHVLGEAAFTHLMECLKEADAAEIFGYVLLTAERKGL